jgi:hypothetical protein
MDNVAVNPGAGEALSAFSALEVTSIRPSIGLFGGGTVVTVRGVGFREAVGLPGFVCRFGAAGAPVAPVRVIPELGIAHCVSPPAVTPGDEVLIGVSADGGALYADSPDAVGPYRYYDGIPVVDSVNPIAYASEGGGAVTVMGSSFPLDAVEPLCRFGAKSLPASSASGNSVVCTVPPGSGLVVLEVSHNGGADYTSSGKTFSFFTLVAVSPALAPADGGTWVSLTGSNFVDDPSAVCSWGPNGASPVSPAVFASNQAVLCLLPEIAVPALLQVEYSYSGSEFFTAPGLAFDAYAAPAVTGLTPNKGPPGSTTVTVTGTDFFAAAAITCRFGVSVVAAMVTIVPTVQVFCTVPEGSGEVTLDVSFNGGITYTSRGAQFAYYNILSIQPVRGISTGGTVVSVSGTGFVSLPSITCRFGAATLVPATFVNPVTVTCAAPPLAAGPHDVEFSLDGVYFTVTTGITFTSIVPPSITQIVPLKGPNTGMPVTLQGLSFPVHVPGLEPSCRFGLRKVVADSWTNLGGGGTASVVCTAPPGSSVAVVEASFNGGFDYTTNALTFTYFSVLSMTPSLGSSLGAVKVTASGSGYVTGSSTARCRFNNTVVPALVSSVLSLTCSVPSFGSSTGNVYMDYSDDGTVWTNARLPFLVYETPVVTGVTPSVGPALGSLVTVRGQGFRDYGAGAACRFDLRSAPATIVSDTELTCSAPEGSGTARVKVSLNGGVEFSTTDAPFTYFNVFSILPASGPRVGGTSIFAAGSGFENLAGTMACRFGTDPGTGQFRDSPAVFVSSAQISCVAPPSTTQVVEPFQLTLDGVFYSVASDVKYSYYSTPRVTAVSPNSGPSRGVLVTLFGEDFKDIGERVLCRFGLLDVEPVTPISVYEPPPVTGNATAPPPPPVPITQVVCPAPPGSAAVAVELSINDGFAFTSDNVQFSYFNVYKVEPASGPSSGGTEVIISGSGFLQTDASECRFANARVPAIVVSPAQVRCVTPELLPGSVSIEFSSDSVLATDNKVLYTYYQTPEVRTVLPIGSPAQGGGKLTVSGQFFRNDSATNVGIIRCRVGAQTVAATQFFLLDAATETLAVVCAAPSGNGPTEVELSFNSGSHFTDNGVSTTYFSMIKIFPTTGPTSGPALITVSGSGFVRSAVDSGLARCGFTLRNAPPVGSRPAGLIVSTRSIPGTYVSNQVFHCEAPQLSAGTYDVNITMNNVEYSLPGATYTAFLDPVVTAINPTTAPGLTSASWVTLHGRNFPPAGPEPVSCSFGTLPGVESRVLSSTAAACRPPSQNGEQPVSITFNGGVSYTPGPRLRYFFAINFFPTRGPVSGGTRVTISGSAFTPNGGGVGCLLAGLRGNATFKDEKTIICDAPPYRGVTGPTGGDWTSRRRIRGRKRDPMPDRMASGRSDERRLGAGGAEDSVADSTSITTAAAAVDPMESLRALGLAPIALDVVGGQGNSAALASASSYPEPAMQGFGRYLRPAGPVPDAFGADLEWSARAGRWRELAARDPRFWAASAAHEDSDPDSDSDQDQGGTVSWDLGAGSGAGSDFDFNDFDSGHASVSIISANARQRHYDIAELGDFGDPSRFEALQAAAPGSGGINATGIGAQHLTTVKLGVTCSGVFYSFPPVPFTYHIQPNVTSIVPNYGQTGGGNPVTLHGANFAAGLGLLCRFGTAQDSAFDAATVIDEHTALCYPPSHADAVVVLEMSYNGADTVKTVPYTYVLCPPGWVSTSVVDQCVPCAPGTYSPLTGGKKCVRCPADAYNPHLGSGNCTACPDNTHIPIATRDNRTLCGCLTNFFQPDGLAGEACEACPRGGLCVGGFTGPVARPGFWAANESATLYLKCDTEEACPGGPPGSCSLGYQGRLCAGCTPGTYQLKGQCEPCPQHESWRFSIFVIFAAVLISVLIKIVGKHSRASGGIVGIATFFFQVLSMLRRLDLNWPYSFKLVIDILTFPFTFDLDVLAGECAFLSLPWHVKWSAMWFLPFAFLGGFILEYIIISIVVTFGNCCRGKGVRIKTYLDGEQVVSDAPSTEFDIRNRCINAYCMLLTILYLLPITKSFEIFDCTIREDGKSTLDAAPALLCYDPWWYKVAPIAAFGILFYVVLMPIAFAVLVIRNRGNLDRPFFIARYGTIYTDFKPTVPYWESLLMVQKSLMLIPIMFFTGYPEFQIAAFLLVLFLGLTVQLVVRPFFLERYNRLQTILRWCSCLMLLLGMAMRANYLLNENEVVWDKQQLAMLGIAFTLLALGVFSILGAITFDLTVIHWELRRRIDKTVVRNLDRLMHPHGMTEMIQWLGRGSLGQEYESALRKTLNAISVEVRWSIEGGQHFKRKKTPLDRFIHLYTGKVFTAPVVPVVRIWLMDNVSGAAAGEITSLAAVSEFAEAFCQFARFQRRFRTSDDFFVRPERPVPRRDNERYARLVASPAGPETLREVQALLRALYSLDLVSDNTVTAIARQIHRGNMTGIDLLAEAFVTLQALEARDGASRAGRFVEDKVNLVSVVENTRRAFGGKDQSPEGKGGADKGARGNATPSDTMTSSTEADDDGGAGFSVSVAFRRFFFFWFLLLVLVLTFLLELCHFVDFVYLCRPTVEGAQLLRILPTTVHLLPTSPVTTAEIQTWRPPTTL